MSQYLFYAVAVACLATLGVLLVGIGGFGTGLTSSKFSNKMMRWRIGLQFVAIVLVMLTVAAIRNGN